MASTTSWRPSYTNRITRRRFIGTAGAAAGAAALIACGGDKESGGSLTISSDYTRQPGAVIYARDNWKLADETAQGVPGGVYPGRDTADLVTLPDPIGSSFPDSGGGFHHNKTYEYLIKTNRGPGIQPGSAEYRTMVGHLAESWEVNGDATVFTLTLRPNVRMMNLPPVNGRLMDIEDWRSSLNRFLAEGGYRANFTTVVDKVEFPDSRHMVARMKAPYGPFIARMASNLFTNVVVPREQNEKPELTYYTPVGTGPQIFEKHEPSITSQWRQNPDYWGGKPFIDRWHYPIIPEYANAYSQFLSKNILSFTPSAQDALNVRKDAPDAIMQAGSVSTTSIHRQHFGFPEANTVPWKDPRVRIALRRAVDYDSIQTFMSNKEAFAAIGIEVELGHTTHLPSDPEYWLDPRKGEIGNGLDQNYFFDAAEARKLVAAAGYPNGFEIEMWGNATSGSFGGLELYQIVLDQLRQNLPMVTFTPRLVGRAEFFDFFQLTGARKGWMFPGSSGGSDVEYLLSKEYHSTGVAAPYHDPKCDALIDQYRAAPDAEKQAAALKDIQRFQAGFFAIVPATFQFGGWSFNWPWLHNTNQEVHKQWLDANMPRRNG